MDLFKCKLENFECPKNVQGAMGAIIRIVKRQQQIKQLFITSAVSDEDMTWMMDNLRVTDKLYWFSSQSNHFSYTFRQLPVKLFIFGAHWFTLQNLLRLGNCKLLQLTDSHLTNENIAQFIDHWKSGALPELEYLQINYMLQMPEDKPIGEVEVFTAFTGHREKKVDGETVSISNGVEVKGNDGRTKALLSFTRNTLKFFVCRDTDLVRGRAI